MTRARWSAGGSPSGSDDGWAVTLGGGWRGAGATLRIVITALTLSAAACRSQPLTVSREPATVRLAAADSAGPLAEALAAEYESSFPWVTINLAVVGSEAAENALRVGAADVAILSWLESRPGQGALWSVPFRRDGIAVILHPSTRLPGVSVGHLQEVFRGRLQEWEGAVLVVVSREEGSGTRAAFEASVMGYHPVTLNAVVASSSLAVIETVAGTPGAIGYVSTLRLAQRDLERLSIMPVDGILPSSTAIADGSYPLLRQLYLAAESEPRGEARELMQWILGTGGQMVTAGLEGRTGINP